VGRGRRIDVAADLQVGSDLADLKVRGYVFVDVTAL